MSVESDSEKTLARQPGALQETTCTAWFGPGGERKKRMCRLEIELEGGNLAKVRSKDVALLHPGPIKSSTSYCL